MKKSCIFMFLILFIFNPVSVWAQPDDIFKIVEPKLKKEFGIQKLSSKERIKLSKFILELMDLEKKNTQSEQTKALVFLKTQIHLLDGKMDKLMENLEKQKMAILANEPGLMFMETNRTIDSAKDLKFSINSLIMCVGY